MNVFIAIKERMFSWAGHVVRMDCEIDLCEGLEMSMEMATVLLERK